MTANQEAWWSYSRERYERLERTKSVEAFGTVDLCGLPMLRAKPCKAGSKGARWFAHCACCQWQALARTAADFYALFGYGEALRGLNHHHRADTVHRVIVEGQAYLEHVPWSVVQLGGKEKLISTGPLVGCIFCGEPASVELRQDKWGRPWPHCNACSVQAMPRIKHSQVLTVGLALAVRERAIDWTRCWETGQTLWSGWRALSQGGSQVEAASTQERTPLQESSHGAR